MSRHHDERLPYEIKEHAPKQRHHQDQTGVNYNAKGKNLEKVLLKVKVIEGAMYVNVIDHQVNGIPHQLCRNDLESVGYNDEKGTKDQMPLILKEILVEVFEFFHRKRLEPTLSLHAKQVIKNGLSSGCFQNIWAPTDHNEISRQKFMQTIEMRIFGLEFKGIQIKIAFGIEVLIQAVNARAS